MRAPLKSSAPPVPTTDEPLVGPKPVAVKLAVPTSWVYAKSESGGLPSYKLGHYRRFKWSEIEEYLRACRSNGK